MENEPNALGMFAHLAIMGGVAWMFISWIDGWRERNFPKSLKGKPKAKKKKR